MSCTVDRVEAPNGEVSQLYERLLFITGDESRALELYVDLSGREYNNNQLDSNGEVKPEELEDLSMFQPHERARLQSSPHIVNDFDSINDNVIRNLAEQLRNAKRSLQRQLNSDTSTKKRNEIEDRISEIDSQIGELVGRENFAAVRDIANEHLDWVDTVINTSEPSDVSLLHAQYITDLWDYDLTSEFLTQDQIDNDSTPAQVLREIGSKADDRTKRLINKTVDWLLPKVNEKIDYKEVEPEDLTNLSEIGYATRYGFNISHVEEPLVHYFVERVKNEGVRNQAEPIQKVKNRLNERTEAVEEDPNSDQKNLLQRDEEGNPTGELLSPFTQSYLNRRKAAIEGYYRAVNTASKKGVREREKILRSARKKLFDQLEDLEQIIDIRIISDDFNTDKSLEDYRQELINKYGEEKAEYAIAKARDSYKNYKQDLIGYKDYLRSKIARGDHQSEKLEDESDSEYRERKIEEYKDNNSPARFLEQEQNNLKSYRAWENTHSLPANTEYYNKDFENLTDSERELWNTFTTIINKSSQFLPRYESKKIHETFIPVVKKNYYEAYKEGGFRKVVEIMQDNVADNILSDVQELEVETEEVIDINPFSGAGSAEQPPIFFTGNAEDVDVEDRTFDLGKVGKMFFSMALNYKSMQEVTPEAQLINRMVQEANLKTNDGKIIKDGAGPVRLQDRVKDAINFHIYKDKREDEEAKADPESSLFGFITSANPLQTYRDNVRKSEIETERDELIQQLEDGEITEDKFKSRIEELKEEYKELGGRSLVWGSLFENTLLRFSQVKGMGLNIGAAIRNTAYGLIANYVHAAGDQEFNESHVHRAFGIIMGSFFNRSKKHEQLLQKYNIFFETQEVRQGEDKKNETLDIYAPQNWTERIVQGITLVSSMLNQEVTNKNGEVKTLWDAHNEDGEWKRDEFGDPGEWQTGGEQHSSFREQTQRVIQQLHGDYSEDSNIPLKRYVLGRAVFQFKTWLPEVINYRFGRKKPDQDLGRMSEGIYRTLGRNARDNMGETLRVATEALLKGSVPGNNYEVNTENISQDDLANIKRAMMELRILGIINIAILAISGMGDDDDERSRTKTYLMNQFMRLDQDITQYVNPLTMKRLVENPMPALRAIDDYRRATQGTYRYLSEEDYRGDHPAWKWMQATPITNQVTSASTKMNRLLDN